ncbi:MAG: Maf family protein [Actinomycetes bacterium]
MNDAAADPHVLVLASASPARLATLRAAGFDPLVWVSEVDEDALVDERGLSEPSAIAAALAEAKARAVASQPGLPEAALGVGCASGLELDGVAFGKPGEPDLARQRWRQMRGRTGVLCTGHTVVDMTSGSVASAVARTRVVFADLSDGEIDAYVATGEPLTVAGGFTLDGLGGCFVTRVEGDPHNVVGISLPLLRELLAELGVSVTDLWRQDVRSHK